MNQRQFELLDLVARHVRFLALVQVARKWFAGQRHARRQAADMVRQLASSGWLLVTDVFARPICPLSRPICEWRHAELMPEFVSLSRQLHQRASLPAALTTVVSASDKTRALLAGGTSTSTRIKLTQTTHDLQLAEVCLHYVKVEQTSGLYWVSEDALPETWPLRERPDALLVDGDGRFVLAVEYGGDYSYQRLAELHHGLASIPLAYEIW
jgi:hypothetical protein